jgi:dTDP-4-amino-4,6-dideoxygalactose transaminase
MDELEDAGIATRPGTHAVHMLGFYRERYGLRSTDFPNALLADKLTIALPLYPQMSEAEQGYVLDHLTRASVWSTR